MKKAIKELLTLNIKTRKDLMLKKRLIARKYSIPILASGEILKIYRELVDKGEAKKNPGLERLLRRRSIRTLSGVAPVAVLVKRFDCPGHCIFCPGEDTIPQSYLKNEPAVMRAIRCNFDPYAQVRDRLRALTANGHEPTKIELIVIGGTWSSLPDDYRYRYITACFKAANEFMRSNRSSEIMPKIGNKAMGDLLVAEQAKNEKSKYKIIGITVETRPDYINTGEMIKMREMGVTRVEIGVQALDDRILDLNKRGHGVKAIVEATADLRSFGFKVTYHIMPGLPGSSSSKDLKMFKQLFSDERFQPDQIKFYPTVVTKGSLLYKWWKAGKYKPYSAKVLEKLIADCKALVPEYVRIIRLIRDIPAESIEAGNRITNLRQVMQAEGVKCRCIRCREVYSKTDRPDGAELKTIKYRVAKANEYFFEYSAHRGGKLYGFCRLHLPEEFENNLPKELRGSALIRELHVYGELVSEGGKKLVQHAGLGKKLMSVAEAEAKTKGFEKIAVIAGIGVRGYYRRLGYRRAGTYMVKKLT